jgi:hypothetical protein
MDGERPEILPPNVVSQPIKLTMPATPRTAKHLGLFVVTLVILVMAVGTTLYLWPTFYSNQQNRNGNYEPLGESTTVEFPAPAEHAIFTSDLFPEETEANTAPETVQTPPVNTGSAEDVLIVDEDIVIDDLLLDDFGDFDDFDLDF